ncbi:MAG: response regulator [Thermodesulfobacteriota bacterium]
MEKMSENVNLLIVDDQEELCEVLKDVFQDIGYQVDAVQRGKEAVAKAEHTFFHVVLIDIILPDISGIEVLKKVKEISPQTEGIIITGNASLKNSIDALSIGAFSYLIKPLDLDEVRAVIRNALEKQRIAMENLLLKRFNENIVSYSPSGLLVMDKEFNIMLANRSCCEIFQIARGDASGKPLKDVLPIERLEEKLYRVQRSHEPLYGLELRYHCPGDGIKVLNASISEIPLSRVTGEETGILLVIQDLTEQNRLEKELFQSQKMAALGETAARVAHEIRNPLQQVLTGVQCFQKHSTIDEEERIALEGIVDGVGSINRIITDLLDYARPVELTCNKVDIHDVLDGVLFQVEEAFRKSNIQVNKRYDKKLQRIWADGFKIKHAFQNIVKNAMEAMPHGGNLTITTCIREEEGSRKTADVLEVKFADTGCGISEEEVERIFQPFYTTKDKGIGLGLAITRNMINLHKGEILVESKVGEGTQMVVRLSIK